MLKVTREYCCKSLASLLVVFLFHVGVVQAKTISNATWVNGSDTIDQASVYGIKGVPDPDNIPGARAVNASWADSDDNFWLFGGEGYDANGDNGWLNDLWKFDGTNWTWVSGSDIREQSGVYGIKGVPDPNNIPGARAVSASWADSDDNFWLYGGWGYDSNGSTGFLNDLWKFDGTNWTWVSGSDTVLHQFGVYGIKGVADPNNVPGSRVSSFSSVNNDGAPWLFGGEGYDANGDNGWLNDLWKFDGTNWTWVSGSDIREQGGVYGIKGIADPANIPGARTDGVSWTDSNDNFWIFGGSGHGADDNGGLNDLWKFDGVNWMWVSGSNMVEQFGVYGTKGIADPVNVPGARLWSVSWTDSKDNLWLFGGAGAASVGKMGGNLNDLWKFDGTNWTWVSGPDEGELAGIYGTKGIPSSGNIPGSRYSFVSWIDDSDNLWLFGGIGYDGFGNLGYLNDLWKFETYEIYNLEDFARFASAWLSEDGEPNFDPAWDIAEPADDIIDLLDLQVFCESWVKE